MFKKLLLAYALVPIVELILLFVMARYWGWGVTLGFSLVSSLAGAFLARYSFRHWWARVRREWASDGFPVHRLGEGALLIFAMALMLTPGPLTGIVGLLFLIPAVRDQSAQWLFRWASNRFLTRFWP